MNKDDAWNMLVRDNSEKKPLSKVLEDMGFDKDRGDFMVINIDDRDEGLKTTDRLDGVANGKRIGGYQKEDCYVHNMGARERTNKEAADDMCCGNSDGKIDVGVTGSNNGLYAAKAYGSSELIVTKNPDIIRELEGQMGFKDKGLGVPFSNGEKPAVANEDGTPYKQGIDARANLAKMSRTCQRQENGEIPKPKAKYLRSPSQAASNTQARTGSERD